MAVYNEVKWVGKKPTVKVAQNGGATVAVGVASTTILAVNDNRTSFLIRNVGDTDVYICFLTPAVVSGMLLEKGDTLFCDDYTGIVTGIISAGAGEVRVIEV